VAVPRQFVHLENLDPLHSGSAEAKLVNTNPNPKLGTDMPVIVSSHLNYIPNFPKSQVHESVGIFLDLY
jgi:hypothetical protein